MTDPCIDRLLGWWIIGAACFVNMLRLLTRLRAIMASSRASSASPGHQVSRQPGRLTDSPSDEDMVKTLKLAIPGEHFARCLTAGPHANVLLLLCTPAKIQQDDIKNHVTVLTAVAEAFPYSVPPAGSCAVWFTGLDAEFGCKLSGATTKVERAKWADECGLILYRMLSWCRRRWRDAPGHAHDDHDDDDDDD